MLLMKNKCCRYLISTLEQVPEQFQMNMAQVLFQFGAYLTQKDFTLSHQKVNLFLPEDFEPKVNCARSFLQQEILQPNIMEKVLFTDESTFTRDGIFDSHISQFS